MTLSEKKFILGVLTVSFLFNLLPYIYQLRYQPADKTYIGSFPIYLDQATYLTRMTQGEEGNWLLINRYTTEPQKSVFLYPFYLALGQLAKIFHLSVEKIFLLSRFIFGLILAFTTIYFIRCFIADEKQRKIAYFLAFFASGLGWLRLEKFSLDFWMPDFLPIVRFSYFPHMTLATSLLFLSFIFIIRALKKSNTREAVKAGAASFILNLVLPFYSFILYSVTLLFYLIKLIKKEITKEVFLKNLSIFFCFSLISFFYMVFLSQTNFVLKIAQKQSVLFPPNIGAVFTGFGLILIFSLIGMYWMYKKRNGDAIFFGLWIFGAIIFAYFNFLPQQRRVLETGLFAPLAVTASFAILKIFLKLKEKFPFFFLKKILIWSLVIFFLLLISLLGNLNNWQLTKLFLNQTNNPTTYLPNTHLEAILWLKENSPKNSAVLSSFFNGNLIPYLARRFVYVGHGPETLNLNEKMKKVNKFYKAEYSLLEMEEFLRTEKINYIFYSDYEKISDNFTPDTYLFLKKVYDRDGVQIFQLLN